jgi:hypothetical protein
MAGRIPAAACACVTGGLSLVCLWTATTPELLCRTALQSGDFEWGRRQTESARAQFLAASQADRWAIEPWDRLADLALQRWQQSQLDGDFDVAIRNLQTVSDRLPFASRPHRRLGQAWLARFERSRVIDHAQVAANSFAAAVERYPHHATLLSEWSFACEAAALSQQAREAARRALRQDDINRKAGHSDKYLNSDARKRMQSLASSGS